VSGTSASVLLLDPAGTVVRDPLMYDHAAPAAAVDLIRRYAPSGHTTLSPTSTLAKLLQWHLERPVRDGPLLCHQADFLAAQLLGHPEQCLSDWNNALKLGYDVRGLEYPPWLLRLLEDAGVRVILPNVTRPGGPLGAAAPSLVARFGLADGCMVAAGTTDSVAAFIASRASRPGQAVTSLGSTLAIKILSTTPVDDAAFGVYSHRLGDMWLVGGASNVGCAVLRQQGFTGDELRNLSALIDPTVDPQLDYYPLTKVGERFPINDPSKEPILDPRPASRQEFLHGLLHGIARVEAAGYARLHALGGTPVTQVLTAGGGSVNPTWGAIRQRLIGVPVATADHTEAAYGVALLALDAAYLFPPHHGVSTHSCGVF